LANKNDVTVTINIQQPTPKIGFGKPLIIGESAAGSAYKNYADLAAVAVDFISTTEVYKAAQAIFAQGDNAPAEIAIITRKTSETAETLSEAVARALLQDWQFLITTTAAVADVVTVAGLIEADGTRQYAARSNSLTDLATIQAGDYERTFVVYHTTITNYPEAAWVGAAGSAAPGSLTWKFKALVGIVPMSITLTEMNAIHALGANTYVTKAGDNVTSEGKMVNGEYIDIVHSEDYLIGSIQFGVQKLLNRMPKVPYTDNGIASIESAVRDVLQRAFNNGMIASDSDNTPLYGTTFKSRQEVDPADRAEREYNDGKFSFQLAGAIHKAAIVGEIIL
jgi:hypothetical protein